FAARSPDGFSTFGLVSLRPAAVIPPLPTIPTIVPRTTAMPTAKVTTNVTAVPAPVEETPFLFIAAAIVVLVLAVGVNLYIFRKR
ncbi:MAG: hypothetical protein LUO82_02970, partial [Methanomicrobiales archaeon]|nr:hypothetical protein [Methanomicrobiales archaeon]